MKYCFFIFLLFVSIAQADDLYTWTDEKGIEHYSTKQKSDAAQEAILPTVARENIDKKITKIKRDTPVTCRKYGGVDCTKGADKDGSVICLDGFKDSEIQFRDTCSEVKLSAGKVQFFSEPDVFIPLKELTKADTHRYPNASLLLTLRNLSGIQAENVSVEFKMRDRSSLVASGPAKLEPFGVGEYKISLDEFVKIGGGKLLPFYFLLETRAKATCDNCQSSHSAKS